MERRFKLGGEFFLALGTAALGVFLAIQTAGIEVSPSYARVGPRVFPWVISFALIGLGLWIAYDVYRTRKAKSENPAPGASEPEATDPGEEPMDRNAFLTIGLGLVLQMALMSTAGFIIASTVLFVCAARAFDARNLALSTAIGVILTTVVYVGFVYGLGLDLPAGILSGVL